MARGEGGRGKEGAGRIQLTSLPRHVHVPHCLQELAARTGGMSEAHQGYLECACTAYHAAVASKPASPAALYNWGIALSDLARVLKSAPPTPATSTRVHPPHPAAAGPMAGSGAGSASGGDHASTAAVGPADTAGVSPQSGAGNAATPFNAPGVAAAAASMVQVPVEPQGGGGG